MNAFISSNINNNNINNVDDTNISYSTNRPISSVSVLRPAPSSFIFQSLPVDPRPPPIPRPTRDSSDSLGGEPHIGSNVARHPSRHGVRGHGHWSVRQVSGPGMTGRNDVGSEHRLSYFGYHGQNGNRRRTTVLHQHQRDASSDHFRQGQHRSGQRQPSYTRRNNHNNRHNSSNDNRRPHANGSQDRYHRQASTGIDQGSHFYERNPRHNGSQHEHRLHSRPSGAHHRQYRQSDPRTTHNHHRHRPSWQASSHGRGRENSFRAEHRTPYGSRSVHWNGQHRQSVAPSSNVTATESRYSERWPVRSSRTSSMLMDRVAEHAMEMLMERRVEVPVAEDDSFAVAVDHSAHPHRGATQTEFSQLPTTTVDEWRRRASRPCDVDSSEVCVICTEHFCANDTLTILPCTHAFHRDCVGTWLGIRRTCPMCRQEL